MKARIELNMPDERTFLNFWNGIDGGDIVCQIIDGKLIRIEYDEELNKLPDKEITLTEFVEIVRGRVISQIEYLKDIS